MVMSDRWYGSRWYGVRLNTILIKVILKLTHKNYAVLKFTFLQIQYDSKMDNHNFYNKYCGITGHTQMIQLAKLYMYIFIIFSHN